MKTSVLIVTDRDVNFLKADFRHIYLTHQQSPIKDLNEEARPQWLKMLFSFFFFFGLEQIVYLLESRLWTQHVKRTWNADEDRE